MTFTGFNIKYPEYEVITPHTKLSFSVRSLTVQEEENMKGSLMTPEKITEHLNKCIYDSIVQKPKDIQDYDTFLKRLTLRDRDALLYGLYHITYEDIRNYEVRCANCRENYNVSLKVSDAFNFKPYPGEKILKERIKADLVVAKGVSAIVKQPSLFDEVTSIKQLIGRPGSTIDMINETLIIEKFEQATEGQEPITLSDKVDILDAFISLPARDKRLIHKTYMDTFGNYGIELKMKSYCQHCGKEELIDIDLVDNFFRSLYGL